MVRCNVEHQNVPEMITRTTVEDGRTVSTEMPNPQLLFDPTWGAVHHPTANDWHTVLGTKLVRDADDVLVAAADHGAPGVAAVRAIDLTR